MSKYELVKTQIKKGHVNQAAKEERVKALRAERIEALKASLPKNHKPRVKEARVVDVAEDTDHPIDKAKLVSIVGDRNCAELSRRVDLKRGVLRKVMTGDLKPNEEQTEKIFKLFGYDAIGNKDYSSQAEAFRVFIFSDSQKINTIALSKKVKKCILKMSKKELSRRIGVSDGFIRECLDEKRPSIYPKIQMKLIGYFGESILKKEYKS